MIQFHGSLYYPVYIYSMLLITLCYFFYLYNKDEEMVDEENSNNPIILLYVIAFVFLVGWRPPSGFYFGDSSNYALQYDYFANGINIYDPNAKEWVFDLFMYKCSQVMTVNDFFLLVEVFYVVPVLLACRKLVPNHYTLMFVFMMGAFSFFSYGTNGIRNGMACSLVILAMAFINGNVMEKLLAAGLSFLAFNIHRSTALPILCMVCALFVRDTRYLMGLWIMSIFISLVAGGPVEAFFTGLGFDDRMSSYSSENVEAELFSSTGFRWDFLLYSSMPIVLGYYVLYVRQVKDEIYPMLLNTYIMANSFWVMMIRASYSNRFAYLSWFMYALVLAYPCLKLKIWEDQGKKTALILLGHLGFTFIMYMLG